MALTKEKKSEILNKLKKIFHNAESAVFVKFNGLTVSDTSDMRNALKDDGVGYFVAKKTLIKRILAEAGIKGELPDLPGEIAVAYPFRLNENEVNGTDLTAPARGVFEFTKKFKENLAIAGGVFEGRYLNEAEMTEIASIPPLQTLYGMFVNIINSPIQRYAIALDQIAQSKA